MKNLKQELALFTGSESFYRHPLFRKYIYTEGVQYLAEKGSAYWLLDYIFAKQEEDRAIQKEPFQAWIIKVKEDKSAVIRVEDGNLEQVARFELNFTDFPIQEFRLWFIDKTLLLPSEY
ncbi:MAG: DUF6876 family protein [Bacteroidota bacterium]